MQCLVGLNEKYEPRTNQSALNGRLLLRLLYDRPHRLLSIAVSTRICRGLLTYNTDEVNLFLLIIQGDGRGFFAYSSE